ncbi:MAG TPA: hypothetical protein VKI61_16010, partial [Chitinophagaceae bacterium]|nr:hypothetical protein [Chitinophagaceae bacterium]
MRLRTNNLVVSIDSVWAYKGVKTFISVNADSFNNKQIGTKKMPDTLTAYEKVLWSKYMILMENGFGEAPATITQPDFLYLLNLRGNSLNRQGQILTGPLFNQYTTLTVKNKFSQPFEAEGNYLYNISPGLIKQKQLP